MAQSTLSETEGGGFNHADNVMLNIPVIQDKLAVRIVATEAYTSGWIDRIVVYPFPLVDSTGAIRGDVQAAPIQQRFPQSNSDQYDTLRGIILWKPTKRLAITLSGNYMGDNQTGISAFDQFPGTLTHYEVFNIPEPKTDKEIIEGLNINYSFDSFNVTLTTAYWARLQHRPKRPARCSTTRTRHWPTLPTTVSRIRDITALQEPARPTGPKMTPPINSARN